MWSVMLGCRSAILCVSLLVASVSGVANAQRGAQALNVNLAELVNEADVVVQGYIVSAHVEAHPQFPNLMTVLVSVQVSETLKGPAHKTMQFRQYIWDPRDQLDAARY